MYAVVPDAPIKDDEQVVETSWAWLLLVFLLFWVISGIAAFFMSLVCFAYSGTVLEKIGGFAIAVLFGPFYWIYYAFVKTYCGNSLSHSAGSKAAKRRR